jgi:hypothetical protein
MPEFENSLIDPGVKSNIRHLSFASTSLNDIFSIVGITMCDGTTFIVMSKQLTLLCRIVERMWDVMI